LFTISRSWYDSVWLYEYLAFASNGDAILLIGDAVLACQSDIALGSFIAKCQANNIRILVLREDLKLRGINQRYSDIESIDNNGFVKLVRQFDKQVAW
jgi:sulfur relay protein TusB/DsrH